jgi:hypothetical protein
MAGSESSGTGLVLFMGKRIEHAITSIEKYVPEVVHIVTSDIFKTEHKRRMKDWSAKYGFRAGSVRSIDDLFEPSAVSSLLNEVIAIADEEKMIESKLAWYLGITGGTMHMSATGTYAAILLGMRVFYVIKPPEGMKPMANRDVIELPQFEGLSAVMHLKFDDLMYLSNGSGQLGDFAKRMPKHIFDSLISSELMICEEEKWFITEEGEETLGFMKKSNVAQELFHNKMEEFIEKDSEKDSESYAGWA